jgi:MYXO-CTERM domain-containing protein
VSEAVQATNIDTSLSVYEARGEIARLFVFRVNEWENWGVFRSDWTRKPAVDTLWAHENGCTRSPLPPLPMPDMAPPADLAGGMLDGGMPADASGGDDAGATPDGGGVGPCLGGPCGQGGCGCSLTSAAWPGPFVLFGLPGALIAVHRIRRRNRPR